MPLQKLTNPLRKPEQRLLECAGRGERLDLRGDRRADGHAMAAMDATHEIGAQVLRELLLGDLGPVHPNGVQLRGAHVIGELDLSDTTLRWPLRLTDCRLSHPGPVKLDRTTAFGIDLVRCDVGGGIRADEATAHHGVDLTGSTIHGQVLLTDAKLDAGLVCSGTKLLTPAADGVALFADRMAVAGSVYLNDGFRAAGSVRLAGARIEGQLDCGDCAIDGADNDGEALSAAQMSVTTGIRLGPGFSATGTVVFNGATVKGGVRCSEATITLCRPGKGATPHRGAALKVVEANIRGGVSISPRFTATGAVDFTGSEITGDFECDEVRLAGVDAEDNALVCDRVQVSGRMSLQSACTGSAGSASGQVVGGAVRLDGARVDGDLTCRGAQLRGVDKRGRSFSGHDLVAGTCVELNDGLTAAGAIDLTRAHIAGNLDCSDATIDGAVTDEPNRGQALLCDRITVGGDVLLKRLSCARGSVRLAGATIQSQLSCSNAQLNAEDRDGNAVMLARTKIGGAAFLDGRFRTAEGKLDFTSLNVAADLRLTGARLDGSDAEGVSLLADRLTVGGHLALDKGFRAAGEVRLTVAQIGGLLDLRGGELAGEPEALRAPSMTVGYALQWAPRTAVRGTVDLRAATVSRLDDDWNASEAHWPPPGRLWLAGFQYRAFGGPKPATVGQRLAWVRKSRGGGQDTAEGFRVQPYEQLATLYRRIGEEENAKKVAIARRRDEVASSRKDWWRKPGQRVLDWTIAYGYHPLRAVIIILVLVGVQWALGHAAARNGLIAPAKAAVAEATAIGAPGRTTPSATECTSRYPCFNSFGYAVDTVVPVIRLSQGEHWRVDAHTGWGWWFRLWTWIAVGLGWLLSTLAVVGFTNVVRKE